MILSFADSKVLGIVETLCASGMLVSGILLGGFGIKKEYGKVLQISFFMAGIFMIGMSIFENLVSISNIWFLFLCYLAFLQQLHGLSLQDKYTGCFTG